MSVSTLSERLRDLETQIGTRLLNRTTRSVAPTEAGEGLLARISPALREISDAAQEIGTVPGEPAGLAAHQLTRARDATRFSADGGALVAALSQDFTGNCR